MAWTKVKTAAVVGAGILLAGGTTAVIVEKHIAAQQFIPALTPWSDAGAATPKAALQSLAWALTHDRMDRAQELMQWEETNAQFGQPEFEHQVALSVLLAPALKDIESFEIVSIENQTSGDVIVKLKKTFKNHNIVPFAVTARLHHINRQWRAVGKIEYYANGSVSTWLPFTASF